MGITTSTPYGRQNISWPDFAHEGGSALHGKIVASIGELSDKLTGVWSGEFTKNDGEFIDVEHNFDMALGELTVAIYVSGAFVQEGSSATWTVTQTDLNNIRVTNNTGGSATFFVYVLGFNIKKVIGDASTTNKGLVTTASQTIGGEKTFADGIKSDTIGEETSGAGVTIDGLQIKDSSLIGVETEQLNQQSSTPATPASGKSKFYVKSDGVAYILNSDGIETPVGSGSTIERVSHTSHGFIVGTPLYDAGTNFAKGNCSDSVKAEVIAMVSRVIDANTFEVITDGIPSGGLVAACFKGGVLPSDGAVCFLSDEDGKLTTTEPSTVGQISKPIFFVRSVDATYAYGYFKNMRGASVGGANLYTSVGLTLAGTAVVQSISNFDVGTGGCIEGHIYVPGSSPVGCAVEIQFFRHASGHYDISAQFYASSFATPPTASINETNGNISITLPTISGATSASITYAINGSKMGAVLPLAIDSNLISWREPTMFRNRIINGGFDIWQRGTSLSNGSGGVDYGADRWRCGTSGTTSTYTRSTDVPTGYKYSVSASDGGSSYSYIVQRIESANCYSLVGKKVTLSFWIKTSNPSSVYVGLSYANSADNFSAGTGISTMSVSSQITSGAWSLVTASWDIPAGGANGLELVIYYNYNSGASRSALITGVQLEPGSVATPFEFRPYGTELALCQRYCYMLYTGTSNAYHGTGVAVSTTSMEMNFGPTPVTMRSTPTMTILGTPAFVTAGTYSSVNAQRCTTTNLGLILNVTGATSGSAVVCYAASGGGNFAKAEAEL